MSYSSRAPYSPPPFTKEQVHPGTNGPRVIHLSSGKYRPYFTSTPEAEASNTTAIRGDIHAVTSNDGPNFTLE
ncbi:hypothetical protein JCM17961_24920 [Endothiovibrio diazotrophicus]